MPSYNLTKLNQMGLYDAARFLEPGRPGNSKLMKAALLTCTILPALCCSALASGTVTNLTQAALQKALVGGGTVLFGTNGTLTLTNTITIVTNTTLDANGHAVIIS